MGLGMWVIEGRARGLPVTVRRPFFLFQVTPNGGCYRELKEEGRWDRIAIRSGNSAGVGPRSPDIPSRPNLPTSRPRSPRLDNLMRMVWISPWVRRFNECAPR
ncbi:hypothetical protein KM043_010098 [Ampulex compressa]|nr:hypothetical protein KM043_010098 [Ampulex compressa]